MYCFWVFLQNCHDLEKMDLEECILVSQARISSKRTLFMFASSCVTIPDVVEQQSHVLAHQPLLFIIIFIGNSPFQPEILLDLDLIQLQLPCQHLV